jgi:hypothetical protein
MPLSFYRELDIEGLDRLRNVKTQYTGHLAVEVLPYLGRSLPVEE